MILSRLTNTNPQVMGPIAWVGAVGLGWGLLALPAAAGFSPADRGDRPAPATPQPGGQPPLAPSGLQESLTTLPFENFSCERREVEIAVANEDGGANSAVEIREVPATIGYTPDASVVIYGWTRNYYFESSETALEICDRVSTILDSLNQEGVLGLISYGKTAAGKNAICAGETCSRPIFTLLPGEDPQAALADFQTALASSPDSIGATRDYVPPVTGGGTACERSGPFPLPVPCPRGGAVR